MPNFLYYYWASNIQKIMIWAKCGPGVEAPAWVELESFKLQLHSLITAPLPLNSGSFENPVVAHTIKIWVQHFGLQSASLQAPILSNHLFTPSMSDLAFRAWHGNGIKLVQDLYLNKIFASFRQLSEKYLLPRSHMFRYLQIRHFVQSGYHPFPAQPPNTPIDILLAADTDLKGAISWIYGIIDAINPQTLINLKLIWEHD